MPARSTGKPKEVAARRSAAMAGAERRSTPEKPGKRVRKAAPNKPAPNKAPQKKSGASDKTAARQTTKPAKASAVGKDAQYQMLLDQNEALRAELDQATARIRKLEEINRNVLDRIDWVIDSLHNLMEDEG